MVYSNQFVACVLVNSHPQKELANGTVQIPFGTEYSLRCRNKHNKRAVVRLFIDGEEVSGNGYIVPAHDYVDIHRHRHIDKAFKFVSLDSAEAVDFGKNGPNHDKIKGVIEARFYLEKGKPLQAIPAYNPWPNPTSSWGSGQLMGFNSSYNANSHGGGGGTSEITSHYAASDNLNGSLEGMSYREISNSAGMNESLQKRSRRLKLQSAETTPVLKDGCTVEGNATGQTFITQHVEVESSYTSVKLFLQGYEVKVTETARRANKLPETPEFIDSLDSIEAENAALELQIQSLEAKQHLEKLLKEKNKALKDKLKKLLPRDEF